MPEFHQDDYDVEIERAEVAWYNKTFAKDVKFGYVHYNRTQRVLNGSIHILEDVSTKLTLVVQFYKFASNEYRFFPITVGANVCEEYEKNNFKIRDLLSKTSNIKPCSLKKGLYYIRNLVMNDFSHFPPHMPRGRYKLAINIYHNEIFVIEGHGYVAVVDKPLKWNKKV
ncbi:hypothetical protein ILUMI_19246 [Ignelater luminosus]|uniref:Uncharacterized protein n=1 Tax=Ignelater luminosus TaxID=2038154 RepID=A0A8K0CMR7_IGNLU|nr:hypothetical protein ILUMI_19246 [Ignelater luminosus]